MFVISPVNPDGAKGKLLEPHIDLHTTRLKVAAMDFAGGTYMITVGAAGSSSFFGSGNILVSVDQAKQISATVAESLTFNIAGLVNHGGVGNMVQCRVGSSSVDDEDDQFIISKGRRLRALFRLDLSMSLVFIMKCVGVWRFKRPQATDTPFPRGKIIQ